MIEQILASHGEVHGAGEIEDLRETIGEGPEGSTGEFPDHVSQLGERDFARIGEAYLNRLKKRSNGERFVTDKMLSN